MAIYFDEETKIKEYTLLARLLEFTVHKDNIEALSKKLFERYGCLCNILNADIMDLMKTDGISEKTAVSISLMTSTDQYIIKKLFGKKPKLDSIARIREYVFMLTNILPYETFHALILDKNKRLVKNTLINSGNSRRVAISIRALVDAILYNDGKYVVVVHTHPNGRAVPSNLDIDATLALTHALSAINVSLIDHLIVNRQSCVSIIDFMKTHMPKH